MAEILDAKQLEESLDKKPQPTKTFRGAVIHIDTEKGFGLELVGGVTAMEAYGAMTLLTERLKKQFGME